MSERKVDPEQELCEKIVSNAKEIVKKKRPDLIKYIYNTTSKKNKRNTTESNCFDLMSGRANINEPNEPNDPKIPVVKFNSWGIYKSIDAKTGKKFDLEDYLVKKALNELTVEHMNPENSQTAGRKCTKRMIKKTRKTRRTKKYNIKK